MKKLMVLTLVAGLALAAPSISMAASPGTASFTQTFHNQTNTTGNYNPCTGAFGTLTLTYNGVFHITYFTNSDEYWATGTETGTFSFAPEDTSQPNYVGRFTAWFGDNSNRQNGTSTSTLSLKGTGSDGSTLTFHEVQHMSVSATGITNSFDKPTCG